MIRNETDREYMWKCSVKASHRTFREKHIYSCLYVHKVLLGISKNLVIMAISEKNGWKGEPGKTGRLTVNVCAFLSITVDQAAIQTPQVSLT